MMEEERRERREERSKRGEGRGRETYTFNNTPELAPHFQILFIWCNQKSLLLFDAVV